MIGDDQVALKWINDAENESITHPSVAHKPERSSDEELLDAYSRAVIHVVEVLSVETSGPAGIAGIRVGDLIVAVNDQDVSSVDDLHRFLAEWPIGKAITLSVIRGKSRKMLHVVPAEAAAHQLP